MIKKNIFMIILTALSIEIFSGIDLAFDQGRIANSVTFEASPSNGGSCNNPNYVVRFDAKAANIGDTDFDPATGVFEYFEAKVFDLNGVQKTSSIKEMFCPMDLEEQSSTWISPHPSPQYGCGDYGITPGWADVYVKSFSCNWANFDGVSVGSDYTIYAKLNPDGSWLAETPAEETYDNNDAWVTGEYKSTGSSRTFDVYEDYSLGSKTLSSKNLYVGVKNLGSGSGIITINSGADFTLQSGVSIMGLYAKKVTLTNSGSAKTVIKVDDGSQIQIRTIGVDEY